MTLNANERDYSVKHDTTIKIGFPILRFPSVRVFSP